MTNIIKSDIFRLKRGTAIRNVFIVGMFIIIITAVNMLNSRSGAGGIGIQSSASAIKSLPVNGADFVQQMRDDGLFPFLILVFVVAVLGADYSAGTIRNSLSYFVNRKSVYFSKCLTGLLLCISYTIFCTVISLVTGSILFGFGGFSMTLLLEIILQILLSIPLYIGMIAIGNLILVFAKKTSITIATYLIGIIVFPSFTYQLYQLFPRSEWLKLCDPLSAFSMISRFWEFPFMMTSLVILFWVILDAFVLYFGAKIYSLSDVA